MDHCTRQINTAFILSVLLTHLASIFSLKLSGPDPMCTHSYAGGIACNFERGICGGILTESDQGRWVWTDVENGPIRTHFHPQNLSMSEGHYMYLAAEEFETRTAGFEMYLSPAESSICVSLHYATTGNDRLVLRLIAQYDAGSTRTLLSEREVNTDGKWENLSLAFCLSGERRHFLLVEVERLSAEQTIAFDHIEISQSSRGCHGDSFSLQCFCDHSELSSSAERPLKEEAPIAAALSHEGIDEMLQSWPLLLEENPVIAGCAFSRGFCPGMSSAPNRVNGPRWLVGDALRGPLSTDDQYVYLQAGDSVDADDVSAFIVQNISSVQAEALRIRIRYLAKGEDGSITIRVYLEQPGRKNLLVERVASTGHEWSDLELNCCMGPAGRHRQIFIEGSGKITLSNTVAMSYVQITAGSVKCDTDSTVTPRSEISDSQGIESAQTTSTPTSFRDISPTDDKAVMLLSKQRDTNNGAADAALIAGSAAAAVVAAFGVAVVVAAVIRWRKTEKAGANSENNAQLQRNTETEESFTDSGMSNPIYGVQDENTNEIYISPALRLENPHFGSHSNV